MIDGRDPQWGLVGDGVADDSPALQGIADESARSSQRVILPPGKFRLFSTVRWANSPQVDGEGPERTVITPPAAASAMVFGSDDVSSPHGLTLRGMTFRHGGTITTPAPMVDIIQTGRKWVVDSVHFDGCYSNRPGLRLATSWVGSVRDCN